MSLDGPLIELSAISKGFSIPSVHRQTVREHLFGLLRPRRFDASLPEVTREFEYA